MKNNVLLLLTLIALSFYSYAQRGVRIAYIDTEYILENVPEYKKATSQLEAKTQKWKKEIQSKLAAIKQKQQSLNNEKPLLTNELINERQEDLTFEENEILDYQQKRFGPNGDLFVQKTQLMQPIQDQIFSAVQDIAEGKKYDFIFDKSSDAVMLFSAKRFDISEQILRTITRTSKRKQAKTKAERKAAKEEPILQEVNKEQEARAKVLEEKKAAKESAIEKRRQEILEIREAKKKEAEARRAKILEAREKQKQAKLGSKSTTTKAVEKKETTLTPAEEKPQQKTRAQLIEENKQKKLAERAARKKALEDKKSKGTQDTKNNKNN